MFLVTSFLFRCLRLPMLLECWIITDGRNYGTSKYLGKMLQPEGSRDSKHSPVFVCATHWGSLHRKELLLGISVSPQPLNDLLYYISCLNLLALLLSRSPHSKSSSQFCTL